MAAKDATGKIDVYVKLPSGRTLSYLLNPTDTIETVCSKVGGDEQVPGDRVILKYTGKVLNRSHTLGYLGVRPETILKAQIIQVQDWIIMVKTRAGKCFQVQVQNISAVRSIAVQIEAEEGIAINRQLLKLDGRKITNLNEKVMDAGIKNESAILVEEQEIPKKETTSETTTSNQEKPDISEEDKQEVLSSFDALGKNVEVVFCFDTTGSMYSCLSEVRSNLRETVTRLISEIPSIRIGIMAHGDYCDYDKYVERHVDLTSNVDDLVTFVDDVPSTGGGDTPECYEWALRKAQQLDWSENSAKAFVMIGDCEPHPVSYTDQHVWWKDEVDVLAGMEVKVYGVRALSNKNAEPFYQEIAERTGGAYLQFRNFSIITEMFLAVCYREASGEHYDQYCQEVLDEESEQGACASNKQEVKDIIRQLDEQAAAKPEQKKTRYVATSWWNRDLDNIERPAYCYCQQTDKWSPNNTPASKSAIRRSDPVLSSAPAASNRKTRFSFRRKSTKSDKKCSIM